MSRDTHARGHTGDPAPPASGDPADETVHDPAKVLRIASTSQRLLEELRQQRSDAGARSRVTAAYQAAVDELERLLSEDLRRELSGLLAPVSAEGIPGQDELRVVEAQLAGWLDGLLQEVQESMVAQEVRRSGGPEREDGGPPAGPGGTAPYP